MTVKTWLICLSVFMVLSIGALFAVDQFISSKVYDDFTMPQLTDALRKKYEYALKNVVDVEAQNLAQRLKNIHDQETRRAMVEQLTDYQRFFDHDEGYYFTYDLNGYRVNVPINKSLNGKDCSDLRDEHGTYFVRELIKKARTGGGFVEYYFEKPGKGIQPKLSYAREIPGTDMLIGAGVYIDGVLDEQKRITSLVDEGNSENRKYQILACALIILFIIGISGYIGRIICLPLRLLTKTAGEVAAGNLNIGQQRFIKHTPREILALRNALNVMVGALRGRIEEAAQKTQEAQSAVEKAKEAQNEAEKAHAEAVSARREGMLAAANQLEQIVGIIASAVKELSARIQQSDGVAGESAHRLSEAATAMNEMNASVQEVARNASFASQSSAETKNEAEAGARVVEQSVRSIEEMHNVSLGLKDDMSQLNEHARNITRIMNVISDIADQTNLLALNAAIEAARAGEAGRGFAVVADEVRKLAEKTMASTADVGNAIKSIQASTSKSMTSMDEAVRKMEQTTNLARQSGNALVSIVNRVEATNGQISSIATASEQQSAASEEINQTIVKVNDMSRETVEAMDGASNSVNKLTNQVNQLTAMINEMKKV